MTAPVSTAHLEAALRERLQAVHAVRAKEEGPGHGSPLMDMVDWQEAKDISSGCGTSFEVKVVSEVFQGKTLIQRHRLVNDALRDEVAQLHAFSQKTYTPAQWEQEKDKTATSN